MENKKGARDFACSSLQLLPRNRSGSHVGMIISFVVFITFLVFLYVVVRPAVQTGEDKRITLDYIDKKIKENTSNILTSISAKISETDNPVTQCARFQQFLMYSNVTARMVVKNETDDIQTSYFPTGDVPIEDVGSIMVDRANQSNLFFKFYYSPEFDRMNETIPGIECDKIKYAQGYDITSINTATYVFEENLYELIDNYQADYETLKSYFSVPPGNEFGFGFIDSNGEEMLVGNASKSLNVYAREIPVQYVNQSASILSGFIEIMVW